MFSLAHVTISGNCSWGSSPLYQSGSAEAWTGSCQHAVIRPLDSWLLWVEVWLWRESRGPEKPYPRRCLPYCTVSEFVLCEVLGHAVCLLTRRRMCCQAAIACQFESTSVTFLFSWDLIWAAISLDPTWWINESYDAIQICFSVALITQCCKILSSDSESG